MARAPRLPASTVPLAPAGAPATAGRRTRQEAAATVDASRALVAQATRATRHALALRGQMEALQVAPRVAFAVAGEVRLLDGGPRARRSRSAPVQPPAFRVAAHERDGTATVVVDGDVDLASAPEVEACLRDHADASRLVVDLSGVQFLDACGMTVLVRAMRRSAQSGQDLVLRAPGDRAVLRALDITGLLTALPFQPAEER